VSERHSAWEESGTFEVASGVFRIPLPLPNDGLHAVNIYVLVDGDELVVIDSGWATQESRGHLNEGLARLDFAVSDITQFLITHSHSDHLTQAVAVRSEYGTPISLGEGERYTLGAITPERVRRPYAQFPKLLRAGAKDVVDALGAWVSSGIVGPEPNRLLTAGDLMAGSVWGCAWILWPCLRRGEDTAGIPGAVRPPPQARAGAPSGVVLRMVKSFMRLWQPASRSHSFWAWSRPRRSTRFPCRVWICPNTGSTIALRLA